MCLLCAQTNMFTEVMSKRFLLLFQGEKRYSGEKRKVSVVVLVWGCCMCVHASALALFCHFSLRHSCVHSHFLIALSQSPLSPVSCLPSCFPFLSDPFISSPCFSCYIKPYNLIVREQWSSSLLLSQANRWFRSPKSLVAQLSN